MSVKTASVLAAMLFSAGVSDADAFPAGSAQQPDCRVGGEPTQPYGDRPPEDFLRYATRPVVIGCATLTSGRRLELVGYQLGRAGQSSLCIDHYDFATGMSSGCGSNVIRGGGAIDATSTTRSAGRPAVVSGTTSASVARVVVRSEVRGRLRRPPATLVRVRDSDVLRAIAVDDPFGRYLAEVTPRARAVTAEAHGARGRTLGLAFFDGFRGAVGQGRACYGRPEVTGLGLLDPARIGHTSRLRVHANYPGGYIGSIEVNVAGRGGAHADLVPTHPRREGGRRVVTLPVRFTRRGAVGVDATAEGRPLSDRCGARPPLRRSTPRTLVVRAK